MGGHSLDPYADLNNTDFALFKEIETQVALQNPLLTLSMAGAVAMRILKIQNWNFGGYYE